MAINGMGLDRRHRFSTRNASKSTITSSRTSAAAQPSAAQSTSTESATSKPPSALFSIRRKHVRVRNHNVWFNYHSVV